MAYEQRDFRGQGGPDGGGGAGGYEPSGYGRGRGKRMSILFPSRGCLPMNTLPLYLLSALQIVSFSYFDRLLLI